MTLLTRTQPSLPASWYYDPAQYARELEAVWYRDWVCVGRSSELARAGDYFVAEVGNERVIVTRDATGRHRAFHDTCRHRGSKLCTEPRGHFASGRIVCPYHAWTYALDGRLLATPMRINTDDFDRDAIQLYDVHVDIWGGFLFVNLSDTPAVPLTAFLGAEARNVERWPLAQLETVHREESTLACNWKVFWENYSECYHCPGVHPELCRVVPIYRETLLSYADRPDAQGDGSPDDPRARVAPGLRTWTIDGQTGLPLIEGPDEALRSLGVVFASFTASLYVVAHPDYVRSVRIMPMGPETVQLTVDWLLPPGVAGAHADQLDRMLELGRIVIAQDARVCELNQQGLRCRRHDHGVLVPQEQSLWQFHEWLRSKLAGAAA
jgi:phenylpropionate dioxygenase-like ring-hydroxylating dioxygenase large terminal subunit